MRKIIFINLMTISAVLGMQNNFAENNRDLSTPHMRPVDANDSSTVESYKSFTDRDWILKIVNMKKEEKDFNAPQNSDGQTILMCATKDADIKIMRQILNVRDSEGNRQININAQDKNGNTALSIAAETGNREKILLLLTNGADVNLAEKKVSGKAREELDLINDGIKKNGCDFIQAIVRKDFNKAKSILDGFYVSVDFLSKTLMCVAEEKKEGYTEGLKLLLRQSDLNINEKDENGNTALLRASNSGNKESIDLLLKDTRINVNLQNEAGQTALMCAASNGHLDVVNLLLKHPGINVNLQNKAGHTALMCAASNGHLDVVNLLLKHPGINVNFQDKAGRTALVYAVSNGRPEIVDLLLRHPEIDVNKRGQLEITALMIAAHKGREEIVDLLLKHEKIDVNERSRSGSTALMFATDKGHLGIVNLLLKHPKIDVKLQDKVGRTALTSAVSRGNLKIVESFFDQLNIDINESDSNAVLQAVIYRDEEIIKFFLDKGLDINKRYGFSGSTILTPIMD